MNIKLSTFRSVLHDRDGFNERSLAFIKSVEDSVGETITIAPLEDYDCDLKLIFIETGGSEGLFLKNFDKLQGPYYFLTSGENNSLAATLEILTFLSLKGLKGEALHGSKEYIASRIRELAFVSGVKKKLSNIKLGVIGTPSDWLISSIPDYDEVKRKLGVSLENISIEEIERHFAYSKDDDSSFFKSDIFPSIELEKAKKVYLAIKSVLEARELSGFTIRCFDLLTSLKTTSCLGLSLLNDAGYISTCEGDIAAMLSMTIASLVGDGYTFQCNPSRIDVENNNIVFAHCTIPTKMLDRYVLDTHFESGTGLAVKGYLKETDVTIFRMSSDLKRYFVSEGKIIENLEEKGLCRTQIRVHLNENVESILKTPCGNHHIVFYGKHKDEIETLMKELL